MLQHKKIKAEFLFSCSPIDQFWYIKIQPNTIDLSIELWGINPTNSVVIPQSLVLRSFVLGWILIYRKWPKGVCFGPASIYRVIMSAYMWTVFVCHSINYYDWYRHYLKIRLMSWQWCVNIFLKFRFCLFPFVSRFFPRPKCSGFVEMIHPLLTRQQFLNRKTNTKNACETKGFNFEELKLAHLKRAKIWRSGG